MNKTKSSLNAKATLGLIIISVISILCLIAIFKTIVHDEIELIEQDVIEKDGQTIVAGVTQQLSSVERLVQNMAKLGTNLSKNETIFHAVFPPLLGNNNRNSHIAGGGIWPEPFTFDKKSKRRSFFWGREQNGILKFYNDYNDPKSKGYHNEEWYVPAKYISDNSTYWSRSYMDPYSYESMVTATVAFKNKQGLFSGVATVDIKLSSLNKLFNEHAKHIKGYVFAVDRNDVFLSFPEYKDIKPYKTRNGKPDGEYFTLSHFTKLYKGFSVYEKHIKQKRKEYTSELSNNASVKKISTIIANESYQINSIEANRIAIDIQDKPTSFNTQKSSLLYLDYDPVLKSDAIASIHYLPKYHWFVAVVTPRSTMMDKINKTTKIISTWIIVTLFLSFIFIYLILYKIILKPIEFMGSAIEVNINSEYNTPIPEVSNDELGQLASLFNKNIDLLEKSRIEANKANNAKSEFLSRMSHELRTPLNAIIGFSDILKNSKNNNANDLESISAIHKAGIYLLTLINDLIDVSRIEKGIKYLKLNNHNLSSPILEITKLVKPIKDEHHVTIKTNIEECYDITVLVDITAIKQVFIKLINNAIKYNKENGLVTINCKKDGAFAQIDIVDTGIGIQEQKLESIFEPFNQIGKEYSTLDGTGIGLYITKNLIEEMNGTISVVSEYEKGSTFTIKLPIVEIDDQVEALQSDETPKPGNSEYNRDLKILIVEDIKSNQKLLQYQIKSFGFLSDSASNGEIALELLHKNKYDLVLTDCTMPVMDGYELTKKIRADKNKEISEMIIIAVTANAKFEVEQKCLDAGMNSYVPKPVDIHLLKHKILQYI